ncbi:MAG TPA: HAMP domain-containing sensor histidine kinase [Verrucomicrobiae bacterium]|jgi:heavy metal sensor kinase
MFPQSIRWRIQMWHGALLVLLVGTLATSFYIYERRARLLALDNRLQEVLTPLLPRVTRPFGIRPGPPAGEPDRAPRGPETPENFLQRAGDGIYYVAWGSDGRLTSKSPNAPAEVPPPETQEGGASLYRKRGELREFIHRVPNGDQVLVGTSTAAIRAELDRLALWLAGAGLLVVGVGIAGGWWLAGRAIRPIADISAAAQEIAGGDLSRRINVAETESELGELADTLNRTFERLEKHFEQQVRFTADASHELRTPLAVMLAETQRVLRRERDAEEYRQALSICERSGERMGALVNSLLELARLDSGEFALHTETCDLARVAREALEFIAPLARQKKITLRDALEPVAVQADATKLGEVLNNLLTNAILHNREGTEVTLTLAPQNGAAVFTVADNGAGIPPAAMPQLFERFYRVDKSRARAQGGSGLGLAISKAIVEAHGGTIGVESEVGQGTKFTVHLPAPGATG